MGVALAALLVLNALFVFALLWGALVLVPTAVALVFTGESSVVADFLRFPVPISLALALVVGFLVGQLVYGYRRVLAGTRLSAGEEETELTRLVTQLSMTAGVSAPAVRVLETETPSCYTVGQFTDATIIVTTGLLEQLDSDELTAVLAHELAHVANRDVTLMTITTLFLEIADSVSRTVRLPRRALADMESLSSGERFAVRYLSVLLVIVYVLLWPVLWLFRVVGGWTTRTLAHAREFAADASAARTTGTPLALATALITLEGRTAGPDEDLRTTRMHALCVVPAPLVTGTRPRPGAVDSLLTGSRSGEQRTDDETRPDRSVGGTGTAGSREERVTAWLDGATPAQAPSATHPPTATRVERLKRIAGGLER